MTVQNVIDVPEGFYRNPACDRHGADDLVSRPPTSEHGMAAIDIVDAEGPGFWIGLNGGLFDNTEPGDFPSLVVSEGHLQLAVELLAERSRGGPP